MPNFQIGGVAMLMWAPMPAAVPPEPILDDLLDEHCLVQIVAALATQLGRVLKAEQALRRELWENLIGEPALGLPLLRVRSQLAVEEAANGLPQLFVLLGEWGSGITS